jgi:hypothetical protein
MLNERKLTPAELAAREKIIMGMKKNKTQLVKKFGKDAERVMYGRATNIVKNKSEEPMEQDQKLKEMVKAALMNPIEEKKGKDLNDDGKIDSKDYLMARNAAIKKNLNEDDWMQKDDESDMAQSQLTRVISLATDLKSMISDGEQLDAWVQAKLTKAEDYLNSVHGYLKGEDENLPAKSPMITALTEKIMQRLKGNK